MISQKREISPEQFLEALQKEYVCASVRKQIYILEKNKQYFDTLLKKKKVSIREVCKKLNTDKNIFTDDDEWYRVYSEVCPEFGIPKFIYNFVKIEVDDLTIPFKGTIVKSLVDNTYGIVLYANIEDNLVKVLRSDRKKIILPMSECVRLSPQETDEYYYYYPGSEFIANLETDMGVGYLQEYDMSAKEAKISFDGVVAITLLNDKIRRKL